MTVTQPHYHRKAATIPFDTPAACKGFAKAVGGGLFVDFRAADRPVASETSTRDSIRPRHSFWTCQPGARVGRPWVAIDWRSASEDEGDEGEMREMRSLRSAASQA